MLAPLSIRNILTYITGLHATSLFPAGDADKSQLGQHMVHGRLLQPRQDISLEL